uniref:dolichyl-phosphate beta-glucosyltransferase n=1 Tax=Caligus clemensi TaxID=344056 RepID=C1C0V8_CALCM|nr:Dolichyl-phosphate beta-glucosyltransferase [Caligus clemensi]
MYFLELILFCICLGLCFLGLLLTWVIFTTQRDPEIMCLPGEESFKCPNTGSKIQFPSLKDSEGSKDLSVVIPAYNEESRLPPMLEETISYLEGRDDLSYEIIVVDDGSKDRTTEIAQSRAKEIGSDKLRVLTLAKNRGKGGAVRMGVLRSRGKSILFADADGATHFPDFGKLESVLKDKNADLVCGSRAHLEDESIASRSAFRTVLMKGFHFCVWMFGSKTVMDTQCGFKLMSRQTAQTLFYHLHIERWAFDVELIKMGESIGLNIQEVAVKWQEIDGSKLDPMSASIQMLLDLFMLWLRYSLRLWSVKSSKKKD